MTYRIGVIGLGQRIASVLAAMAEVGWNLRLEAYADPAPVGAPILEKAGIRLGRACADPAELLRQGPFDLLMLGAPNHLHFEHLMLALDAGVPIFAEKPIVRTEDETEALARRLSAPRTPPVYVGLVMRSMPIVREVIARVDAGELGEIVSLDATEHLAPEHGGYLARNWRRRGAWGGSYLLDKVVHDFDVFGRLVGSRAARVASFGGRRVFIPERSSGPQAYEDGSTAYGQMDAGWSGADHAFSPDTDVADHQVALIEYANQVRLSFHANSHAALPERRWYIAGTEGTLLADLVRNTLMIRPALFRGKPERIDYGTAAAASHNGADQAMARDLLETMEGRAAFPVSPGESMEAGLTVMAIDRAMAHRQVVDCAPMWARYDAVRAGAAAAAPVG